VLIQQRRFLATTRQFGGRVLAAQEEERAWIARELHDDLIQRVAMIGHDLEELERARVAEPVRLAGIREELHDLAGEIRRLAHRMHPAVLDHLGLSAALEQLVAEFEQQGLRVRLDTAMPAETVSPVVATCLYRVAQEALRNVARHAGSAEAALRLRPEGRGVLLEVEDSGRGFDPESSGARAGLGLTSLAERIRLVHGRLSVRSEPGQGTRIAAWAPTGLRA
jgi:signal transduction histidine kinase